MGTTEENIVYQLLDSIRAGELNNDEVVGERQIKAMMRVHRAELILKYSLKGMTIQDVCFQDFPLTLTPIDTTEFTSPIPKLIRLPSNFGVKLTNLGHYNIPVVAEENYYLAKNNPILKYQPKAILKEGFIQIYIGKKSPHAIDGGSQLSSIIDCFQKRRGALASAILDDPNDSEAYDWTTSQYPMPPELIEELKSRLLRKEFQIILQTKSDQVPNMKNDTLRYHDQRRIQE